MRAMFSYTAGEVRFLLRARVFQVGHFSKEGSMAERENERGWWGLKEGENKRKRRRRNPGMRCLSKIRCADK